MHRLRLGTPVTGAEYMATEVLSLTAARDDLLFCISEYSDTLKIDTLGLRFSG